ncbi:MAG: phosphopantetheine-binding protein [Siculibacillus sp.]
MSTIVRNVITDRRILPVSVEGIADDDDLFALGLDAFQALRLMLAVEEACDVEFAPALLIEAPPRTIAAVDAAVAERLARAASPARAVRLARAA